MRTIKFRGKCIKSGDWVYGDLIHGVGSKSGRTYILPRLVNLARVKHCDPLDGVEVHPETVGQFTGLLDKDGKEIYEGDVVKVNKYGKTNQVSVSIDEDGVFPFAYKYTEWDGYCLSHNSEIIGNIHDNPELL